MQLYTIVHGHAVHGGGGLRRNMQHPRGGPWLSETLETWPLPELFMRNPTTHSMAPQKEGR